MTQDNPPTNRDEWLADFADQVLDGEVDDLSTVGSDPETRALAETILRLNHAFPKEKPDAVSAKRIQAGVMARWRREGQQKSWWSRLVRADWLQYKRPQFAMTMALIVVVGLLIVASPYLLTSGGPVAGTAGSDSPLSIAVIILIGILIAVVIWIARRKP